MPLIGLWSVGKALSNAGGQQLRDAVADVAKNGGLVNAAEGRLFLRSSYQRSLGVRYSSVVLISPAPNLSASHLIHVHSPKWHAATQEQCVAELDTATLNILALADQQGLTSVAIPSISSGRYVFVDRVEASHYPREPCLVVVSQSKQRHKPFWLLCRNISVRHRRTPLNKSFSFSTIRKVSMSTRPNYNAWSNSLYSLEQSSETLTVTTLS
jgi:hypothetical protein